MIFFPYAAKCKNIIRDELLALFFLVKMTRFAKYAFGEDRPLFLKLDKIKISVLSA